MGEGGLLWVISGPLPEEPMLEKQGRSLMNSPAIHVKGSQMVFATLPFPP